MRISPAQQEVLTKLRETKQPLVRVPGGFWTYKGCADKDGAPEWWTTVHTLRALETKGLLCRLHAFPEEWRDDRGLVENAGTSTKRIRPANSTPNTGWCLDVLKERVTKPWWGTILGNFDEAKAREMFAELLQGRPDMLLRLTAPGDQVIEIRRGKPKQHDPSPTGPWAGVYLEV